MTYISGIILFLVGFLIGSSLIWFFRQREIDASKSSHDQLKSEFGDLSKQARDQNLETFLKLAENKFGELLKSSDSQMDEKKKLIDSSIEGMKKNLDG